MFYHVLTSSQPIIINPQNAQNPAIAPGGHDGAEPDRPGLSASAGVPIVQ